MNVRNKLFLAVATVASMQSANASVNSQSGNMIEEITVTARKKVESLQSVPLAIDAISASTLKEKNIQDLESVAKLTPGLVFDIGLLPNDTRPVIRGLSAERGRPNVAVLVDGIDISSEAMTTGGGGSSANVALMDLERVEVVKGPQSVLYGRGAFTGAINYVTKRPTFAPDVHVDVDVDQYSSNSTKFSASGGLIDNVLAAGINLAYSKGEGNYENPNTGGELGGSTMSGAAISLNWTPTDNLSAFSRIEYSEQEYTSRPLVFVTALSNAVSDPFSDPFLIGSLANNAEWASVPGTSGCGATPTYSSDCLPYLFGAIGKGAQESDIDLSPDPNTGKDYPGTNVENFRTHAEISWDVNDDLNVTSLTGYNKNSSHIQEDFDVTNYTLVAYPPYASQIGFSSDSDTKHELEQFSQELRLSHNIGNWDWMVSALYWHEELTSTLDSAWWLRDGADLPTLLPYLTPAGINNINTDPNFKVSIPMYRETKHTSLAGSAAYSFSNDIRLTLEARYLTEKIDYKGDADEITIQGAFLYPSFNLMTESSREDEAFLPRITLDWKVSDDVFAYGNIATGFKPGGTATTGASGDMRTGQYDPEKLTAFEIGAKSMWLDDSLQLNGAIFHNIYTDQQIAYNYTNDLGVLNNAIANAGESQITGFEIDARFQATDNLILWTGYTYSDAEFKDFNLSDAIEGKIDGFGRPITVSTTEKLEAGNIEGDFSGKTLPFSAKHAANLGIRFEDDLSDGMDYFIELSGMYQSKRFYEKGNQNWVPEYSVWDLSAGLHEDNWAAILYVDNVMDNDTPRSVIGNPDYGHMPLTMSGLGLTFGANVTLPQPRTAGVRFSYQFQ
ncbi:TonB-dependent receptor [Microbulbifer sp. SA54]|uniref:TonB-dependent receptor n=1 Tax=Microbulbifer sp. SA54 TaxID=3401577 RepID=UPI003AABC9F4